MINSPIGRCNLAGSESIHLLKQIQTANPRKPPSRPKMARSAFASSINALTYAAIHKHTQLRRQWLNSIALYIEQQKALRESEQAGEQSMDTDDVDENLQEEEEEEDNDSDDSDDDDDDDDDVDDLAEFPDADYALNTRQPFAIWAWHNLQEGVLLASVTAEFGDAIIPSHGGYPKRVTQAKLITLLDALPTQPHALQDNDFRRQHSRI